MKQAMRFVQDARSAPTKFTAVSVCSGAGLSDFGYALAGFKFLVQCEVNPYRAAIGKDNFPDSEWVVGDIRQTWKDVVRVYREKATEQPDLLVATPPCQGMSSSNPSRGKRTSKQAKKHEEKNALILAIIPLVRTLKPRVIVAENVRQLLTLRIAHRKNSTTIIDDLCERLFEYSFFTGVVDVADYGVPQGRKRSVVVGIRNDQECLSVLKVQTVLPWPVRTHGNRSRPKPTLGKWLRDSQYDRLDARSHERAKGKHPLHFVPSYQGDRYLQVSSIPKNSGRSAYENDECPECGHHPVPFGLVRCNKCASIMRNRPYVFVNRKPRLISGFKSSYRRMDPKKPAPTITTNSSHVGSDFKIHPYENRVLSILECADLQTVPRKYDWSRPLRDGRAYAIRNVVGEAFPPFFTFLHGKLLSRLLNVRSANLKDAARWLKFCQPQAAH